MQKVPILNDSPGKAPQEKSYVYDCLVVLLKCSRRYTVYCTLLMLQSLLQYSVFYFKF